MLIVQTRAGGGYFFLLHSIGIEVVIQKKKSRVSPFLMVLEQTGTILIAHRKKEKNKCTHFWMYGIYC